MSKIFITGSSDGLGLLAAKSLIASGHQVLLHARNRQRADAAFAGIQGALGVVTADLSSIEETKQLAEAVNAYGRFDAVIHNAGIFRGATPLQILCVNIIAPYILTCLIGKPSRIIYLSSDLHKSGNFQEASFSLDEPEITYADTKLHIVLLAKAVAKHWPDVYSNAVTPGWVPTKMGGSSAPDDLEEGYMTQVWLATSNDPAACVSGKYFFHRRQDSYNPAADNVAFQDSLLRICSRVSGVTLP